MSDSEEDSNNSEKNWPMNEDWMLDILKDDDKSEAKVKINVRFDIQLVYNLRLSALSLSLIKPIGSTCRFSISVPNQYVSMV